jgi:MFS superfamily sulfate permease-like transporter
MSALTSVDASALAIVEEIVETYCEQGKRVCFVKLSRKILYKFQLAGILEKVGFENLFRTLEDVLESLKSDNSSGLSRSRTELTPRFASGDKIRSFNY